MLTLLTINHINHGKSSLVLIGSKASSKLQKFKAEKDQQQAGAELGQAQVIV